METVAWVRIYNGEPSGFYLGTAPKHGVEPVVLRKEAEAKIKELEAENARLRQQRDAANAQLDFVLENLKEEKAP